MKKLIPIECAPCEDATILKCLHSLANSNQVSILFQTKSVSVMEKHHLVSENKRIERIESIEAKINNGSQARSNGDMPKIFLSIFIMPF